MALVKVQQNLAPHPYRSASVFLPQHGLDRFDIVVGKFDMVLLGSRHFLASRFLYAIMKRDGKRIMLDINVSVH